MCRAGTIYKASVFVAAVRAVAAASVTVGSAVAAAVGCVPVAVPFKRTVAAASIAVGAAEFTAVGVIDMFMAAVWTVAAASVTGRAAVAAFGDRRSGRKTVKS